MQFCPQHADAPCLISGSNAFSPNLFAFSVSQSGDWASNMTNPCIESSPLTAGGHEGTSNGRNPKDGNSLRPSSAIFPKKGEGVHKVELSDAARIRYLEEENVRLKKLLAEQMLDIAALRELLGTKW